MSEGTILRPGENCWRVEPADRARLLVDGADYFHVFRETAKNARNSLLIIGWDIDSRFELERERPADGLPTRLRDFLECLVRRSSGLRVYLLDWDYSMVFAADREWLPWYSMDWTTHRRLRFRRDGWHPVGASHHQKIVVVDDCVAFVGGLDFALGRWDSSLHLPDDPRRCDLNDTMPQPYHDAQLMVSGTIAGAIGQLARARWRAASRREPHIPAARGNHDPWPETLSADLVDIQVGIARTYPRYNGQEEIREVERLVIDAIAAARETIYIENQYFTAHSIGEALAARLAEEDGPEIIVILPQRTVGWLSQMTMDVLRERLLRRLYAADSHGRLRVYYPYVPGLGGECINVHAKVLAVDDDLLCVGSANFNNRSMGLDTECNLAVEAGSNARIHQGIAALRNRLLAEHLDAVPASVAEALARHRSLIRAIETLSRSERSLRPFEFRVTDEVNALVPEARIADPEEPVNADRLARRFVTDEDRRALRRSLTILASILFVLLLLAASWRWTPLGNLIDLRQILGLLARIRAESLAPLMVILVYVLLGLVAFPVTLLTVATGMAFGAGYGFTYAMLGAELSALVGYAVGRRLGRDGIRNLSTRWVPRVSRHLAQQGLLAIITLRVIPVAPFTVINVVAGASRLRFRDFAAGTLLGMLPGTLVLTVFSDQVVAALNAPQLLRLAGLLILAIVLGAGTWLLSRWLLRRQQRGKSSGSGNRPADEPD